jgi:hypothetical protein
VDFLPSPTALAVASAGRIRVSPGCDTLSHITDKSSAFNGLVI